MNVPALLATAAAVIADGGTRFPTLPDGVYLNLPEPIYFAQGQDAVGLEGGVLGTTDLATLWLRKRGWWWKSRNNPFWKPTTTDAKDFGSATHALLLEGVEAFNARFAVEPNPNHYPELIRGYDGLLQALRAVNAPLPNKARKEDLAEAAKVFLKDRHVWENILATFERTKGTRTAISFEERWKLQVMLEACLADPLMNAVVTAGQGVRLSEVSIFWTLADGVRLRFRMDTLLPPMVADLKTLRGSGQGDLAGDIGKTIGLGALDVQAAMSFEARRVAYRFIEEGRVYGGTKDQLEWLARFPAEAPLELPTGPGWKWLWMFYQKADATGVAPTILPLEVGFGSTRHRLGYRKAMAGLELYRAQVAKVGLKEPWTQVLPVHTLEESDPARRPVITIPHWIEEPGGYAPGEEEAMTWRS